MGCGEEMNQQRTFHNQAPPGDMLDQLCASVYLEASSIAEAGYPENRRDLFMEQGNISLPGPSCSTTSLVNETLKFQTLISQICQYFLLKKCEKLLQCKSFSHFVNKNISVFGYKVIKHLTS